MGDSPVGEWIEGAIKDVKAGCHANPEGERIMRVSSGESSLGFNKWPCIQFLSGKEIYS